MKELSIEEKAKAYDKAVSEIRNLRDMLLKEGIINKDGVICNNFNRIFPELEESEDEKIRKELIRAFKSLNTIKVWNGIEHTDILAWLEKLGDKKPSDKAEPKFKVGDWCIDNEDGTIFQIVKVLDNTYTYKTNEGKEYSCTHYSLENDARIWTIQDAKDGDVLVASDGSIFLFKCTIDCACKHYAALTTDGTVKFNEGLEYYWETSKAVQPATKEQRDTLEKAMADAGYTFNFEKKELKKIVTPIFHVGDRVRYKGHACDGVITEITDTDYICGNAKLPISTQDNLELVEQKHADKIEPKFKVSDWIITNKNHIWYIDETPETTSYLYRLINQYGKVEVAEFEVVDNAARLWTIQDAKDGDILFQDLMGGKTFIYNGVNPDMAILYSFIISNDGEDVLPYHIGKPNTGIGNIEENKDIIHPVTKEQRDLLFQKMREAGYEWDAEKKELKKIHNALEECEIKNIEHGKYYYCIKDYFCGGRKQASKGDVVQALRGMSMMALGVKANEYFIPVNTIKQMSTWSEEDEKTVHLACEFIRHHSRKGDSINGIDCTELVKMLESLKGRVLPQSKQEWSEEDERIYRGLHNLIYSTPYCDSRKELSDWFKSLKDRVKPQNK